MKFIKSHHNCTVRQFMSLIGLLTATEKQVYSGRLHMRPIQWHLKWNWHVPEVPEKIIPVPQSLHPHLDWWLDGANVLKGQPLHPLQHAVLLFTDAANEGWGAHLGDFTARGVWSPVESRLHINYLELKAVLLALRQFEHLCRDHIVLVATDNTTVVSYINKQGGMKSGSLCALLWRLLSWCHPRGITLWARHIPDRLNVIADKLSRHNQVIQTEWSLSQQVFNQLCSKWAPPLVDLFATRFNHKLPSFVSPVPDQTAWAVDTLSLSWEHLNVYAFPPVYLLPQVVSKLRDQGCLRMVLIAPGWPNMPWFWDLVDLSVQIPFSLLLIKDLVIQPFNGLLHRNLQTLNLHAWLLEALPSGNTVSLRRWQHELKLLRGAQPEPCTSQSALFLSNCVNLTRLGSGKRRSEIHAWLSKNIRHQEDWSKVSLYPSPSFLSKNQLARDGPAAVAPVVIPALAPTLDKSMSEDRSLCPVLALRYYLDRTQDLRQGKDLVFVSFRKDFQKDIVPAIVSSWIKQTVLLCYQLSDQKGPGFTSVQSP